MDLSGVGQELASLDGHITDVLRSLSNGFQKLEKIKDTNRQSRQLEELTGKMKECKRLIKEFDREIKEEEARSSPDIIRKLIEKKQSMASENWCHFLPSQRTKFVVQDTINVGADTSAALKAQTEQMSRIVNEFDSLHFSIKKVSKLVKEIGRQVVTDRYIMALLVIIVLGVIAIITVKIINPHNK